MPIHYACVAQYGMNTGYKLVGECVGALGEKHWDTISSFLGSLQGNQLKSYISNGRNFCVQIDNSVAYVCVCDMGFQSKVAFAFLEKLVEEYDGRPDFEARMRKFME